jgi:hypothetical protein
MGGFRSQPDIEKHTVLKESQGLTYAVTNMCGINIINIGWRQYMEDAHIATLLSDKKNHLFAIFDGHGGNLSLNQVHKLPALSRNISYMSYKSIKTTK